MTWQECRDTSLQKLFQCYNGPDEDEATLRYLAAMPATANEGIALLCAARPLRGVAELPEGTLEADLGSLAADYGGMGQPEVSCAGGRAGRCWAGGGCNCPQACRAGCWGATTAPRPV